MKDISTRQLRAFVALADARHFTRAAQRCHLTQPAFSAVIRSLELGLGARLFDRSTRSVDLTPEGQVFEASARRLLAISIWRSPILGIICPGDGGMSPSRPCPRLQRRYCPIFWPVIARRIPG